MPSSPSDDSSTIDDHKFRQTTRHSRPTRQQLRRNLEILGALPTPLPPALPLSPPASRSSSPQPPPSSSKRKLELASAPGPSKRPRTSDATLDSRSRISATHQEPCEEGELRDDSLAARPPSRPHQDLPVRRPRKNIVDSDPVWQQLLDKFFQDARDLKYSGTLRTFSSYSPTHKAYKPLHAPPPPRSLYHKHSTLIAKLELIDALVTFAYSHWIREIKAGGAPGPSRWEPMHDFINFVKQNVLNTMNTTERERALLGLIFMLEAFIWARLSIQFNQHYIYPRMRESFKQTKILVEKAIANSSQEAKATRNVSSSQPTPPMLPSPASINSVPSANSTPTNRGSGTPSSLPNGLTVPTTAPTPRDAPEVAAKRDPPYQLETDPDPISSSVHFPLNGKFIHSATKTAFRLSQMTDAMTKAEERISLRVLAEHYPRTFARMVYSTLGRDDEKQPDFEDEEGELFWPGSPSTGDGVAWVCLMGKAMIMEFGKEYGYISVKGAIPKPSGPTGSQR